MRLTDHKAVTATINAPATSKPVKLSPHQKFNNKHLHSKQFVKLMTQLIHTFIEGIPTHNTQQHWDTLKDAVRDKAQILLIQRQIETRESNRRNNQTNKADGQKLPTTTHTTRGTR